MPFADRADAGRRLAGRLAFLQDEDVVVWGLARGGIPVAFEVAQRLHAPLDVLVVRKLGVPFQPELGMGAVAEGGESVLNPRVVQLAGLNRAEMSALEAREQAEVRRRAERFRGDRPPVPVSGRTVVVVDDGIATGSTARAACRAARDRGADRVILAVPVASPEAIADLGMEFEVVCIEAPHDMWAVGQWYRDFTQTPDAEVIRLVNLGRPNGEVIGDAEPGRARRETLQLTLGGVSAAGDLVAPEGFTGTVVFAHGSGSSRLSPRNRYVSGVLNRAGLATLMFDLLGPNEGADRSKVFDIELLGRRLAEATRWARSEPSLGKRPFGYFGASTGAGAALWAAAEPHSEVAAIVSRGGRPDLAGPRLGTVRAPTLLIVGGRDDVVLRLNEDAQSRLSCANRLVVIPGATHLFEEPGALEEVASLAATWLVDHLTVRGRPAA